MNAVDTAFCINLAVALLLGSIIGLERQWRQRRAGLRTNALVAVGAALFVMATDAVGTLGDHARIAAQVVSGIGFLGAGVIMRDGLSVRGLNTAATLWCSAAVGVLCGYSLNMKAALGTIAIMSANVLLRPLAQRINREPVTNNDEQEFHYYIAVECRPEEETRLRYLILQNVAAETLVLKAITSRDLPDKGTCSVTAIISSNEKSTHLIEHAVNHISMEPGVTSVSWKLYNDTPSETPAWPGLPETV